MNLAHVAIATPRQCGLYETVRELVAAERAMGHDARIVDPKPTQFHPGDSDRGAKISGKEWLLDAEVIVDHSGCDGTTDDILVPHILVSHGRPRHSFLSERSGGPPIYSYWHRLERSQKYRAVVTFWPEHVGHLRAMFKTTPVYSVPATVDMDAWTPGQGDYGFGGKRGAFNIVLTDAWRDDSDPFDALHAVLLAARQRPGIKAHLYGRHGELERGWGAILNTMVEEKCLGEVCRWVNGLEQVYRAADLLLTTNSIATRARRESLACGCPVLLATPDVEATAIGIRRMVDAPPCREDVRRSACMYEPKRSAAAFVAIAERVVHGY